MLALETTITPPTCPSCRTTMVVLRPEEMRDRVDPCGHLAIPSLSVECRCPDCRDRCIVTTRHTGELPRLGDAS